MCVPCLRPESLCQLLRLGLHLFGAWFRFQNLKKDLLKGQTTGSRRLLRSVFSVHAKMSPAKESVPPRVEGGQSKRWVRSQSHGRSRHIPQRQRKRHTHAHTTHSEGMLRKPAKHVGSIDERHVFLFNDLLIWSSENGSMPCVMSSSALFYFPWPLIVLVLLALLSLVRFRFGLAALE